MTFAKAYSIAKDRAWKLSQCIGPESPGITWKQTFFAALSGTTARKSMVALVDQGIVSVANFLTGLIIGRICTKEQFGLYMLGFTIIVFIINVQGFLISTPYTIYSPRLKGIALAQYTGSTLVHQLALSVLIIFFLIITGAVLSLGIGPPGLLSIVKTLIFVISFILLRDYARRVCLAALRMKTVLILDFCVTLLQLSGLLLLAHLGLLSASGVYWVVGTACGIATLIWLISMRKGFKVRFTQAISDLRQNLATGLWIFGGGVLWTLGTSLYPWLLAFFHGTASAGVWAACQGLVALSNPFFIGLQNVFGPKIAHAYANGEVGVLRRFSLQTTAIFVMAIAPFCLALLIFGGHLVTGLYGSKYAGNGLIVSTLALNLLISALAFSPSRALLTIERADVDFKINLLLLLGLFSFGILLVRHFGPVGAAISLLLSNSGCLVFRYIAFSLLVRSSIGIKQMRSA